MPVRPLILATAALASACAALGPEPLIQPDVLSTEGPEPSAAYESAEPVLPEPQWVRVRTLLGVIIGDHELQPLGRIEDLWIDREGRIETITIDLDEVVDRLHVPTSRVRWNPKDGPSLLNLHAAEVDRAVLERQLAEQAKLFQTREVARLEGRITQVVEPEGKGTGFLFLKLRQPNNHFHRVLLAPIEYAREANFQLRVEDPVTVEAVETRDEKGRLWVAKSFTTTGAPVPLRDAGGAPVWKRPGTPSELAPLFEEPRIAAPAPQQPPPPADQAVPPAPNGQESPEPPAPPPPPPRERVRANELIGTEVVCGDGRKAKISGLIVDDVAQVAAHAVVESAQGERLLPWKLLGLDEAPWRTAVPLEELEASPALRSGSLGDRTFWRAVRSYYEARLASVAAAGAAPAAPPPSTEAATEMAELDGPPGP